MKNYNGCTFISQDKMPSEEEVTALWAKEGNEALTAAYYYVNDKLLYVNRLGERKTFDLWDYLKGATREERDIELATIEGALSGITDNSDAEKIQKTLEFVKQLTQHDPILFRIPITPEKIVETDTVPEPEYLYSKQHAKHFDLYLDAEQEQSLLRNRLNKTQKASQVTLMQSALAIGNKKDAKHRQHLEAELVKHPESIEKINQKLETLDKKQAFRNQLQLLLAPFNNFGPLINNVPDENPLATVLAAAKQFKIEINALIESAFGDDSALLLAVNQEIDLFIAQGEKFTREGISDKQLERLFAIQNRNAQNNLAQALFLTSVEDNIYSLGQLELTLMPLLQAASIAKTYGVTDNRARQLAIKDHDVTLMAAAKKDTGLRGGVYGARHNNAREAIDQTMLDQQRLIAFDPALFKEKPQWKVFEQQPTLVLAQEQGIHYIGYIRYDDQLWYINQALGECKQVSCDDINALTIAVNKDSEKLLDIITQHTGHSTKRMVPTGELVDSPGDVEDLDDMLSHMTHRSYGNLQGSEFWQTEPLFIIPSLNLPTMKTIKEKPLRGLEWATRFLGLAPAELVFFVGRAVVGIGSMVVSVFSEKNSKKIDAWAMETHNWLSMKAGYAGYQFLVNETYRRREKDDHQRMLEQVKQRPDNVIGALCDEHLHGAENAAWLGDQARGVGTAIGNFFTQLPLLVVDNRFVNRFKSQQKRDEAVEACVKDLDAETTDAIVKIVIKGLEKANARIELEKEKAEYYKEKNIAIVSSTIPDRELSTAKAVKSFEDAKTVSIFNFFDEVMVSGLTHALIWKMFQEAPALAPLLFMMSSASMGLTLAGSGAAAWLHAGPNAMGYLLTGKHASEGAVSASVGNFAFFKIPSATSVLITKLYEGDTDFIKQLTKRPEILLGFALLVGIGYGFSCIPTLPTHGHVHSGSLVAGHATLIPATVITTPLDAFINTMASITAALAEEALICVEHGMPGPNSIELAFMALKSMLFIEALVSGRHVADRVKKDEKAIEAQLRKIAVMPSGRVEAFDAYLKTLGIQKSVVRDLEPVKNLFEAITESESTLTELSEEGKEVYETQAVAFINSPSLVNKEPVKEVSVDTITVMPKMPDKLLALETAKRKLDALLATLRNHASLGADAPKIKKPDVIWNQLYKLIVAYQNECGLLGRHDLQEEVELAEVLRGFFLDHCYHGTVSGLRPISSTVGQVWRPIKGFMTDSPIEHYRITRSYNKDKHDALHLGAIITETGHAVLEAGTYSAREVAFIPVAVGQGLGINKALYGIGQYCSTWYKDDTKHWPEYDKTVDSIVTSIHLHGTNTTDALNKLPGGWILNGLLPSFKWRREETAEVSYQTDTHSNLAKSLAKVQASLAALDVADVKEYAKNSTTADAWAAMPEIERERHVIAAKRFAEEQVESVKPVDNTINIINTSDIVDSTVDLVNPTNQLIIIDSSDTILDKPVELNFLERGWKSGAEATIGYENHKAAFFNRFNRCKNAESECITSINTTNIPIVSDIPSLTPGLNSVGNIGCESANTCVSSLGQVGSMAINGLAKGAVQSICLLGHVVGEAACAIPSVIFSAL